jgi:putative transposase
MSRKYKFRNPEGFYFITYTVVNWIDIFIRNEYREIMLDSWKYCIQEKGLVISAWCIMTSHIHMIIGSRKNKLENIMRDMKSHTSTSMKKAISENPVESRKKWMIKMFVEAGSLKNHNKNFQFWQHGSHPVELYSNEIMEQKLDYIHENPVKAGFVNRPEDYVYSSAIDYAGGKGMMDIVLLDRG